MSDVLLYTDPDQPGTLFLGEVQAGEGETTPAVSIHARNMSGYTLRQVRVEAEGANAEYVKFWAGGEMTDSLLIAETLEPDAEISFSAIALSPPSDAEPGPRKFEFVVHSTSIG